LRRADAEAIRAWVDARVGKTQRLSALRLIDELPRRATDKVLGRGRCEAWAGG